MQQGPIQPVRPTQHAVCVCYAGWALQSVWCVALSHAEVGKPSYIEMLIQRTMREFLLPNTYILDKTGKIREV